MALVSWYCFFFASHCMPLNNNLFASDLSPLVVDNKSTENVAYSPLSAYISLLLMLTGATGQRGREIRKVLWVGDESSENLAKKYNDFLSESFVTQNYGRQLSVANRLFVNNKVKVFKKYRETASLFFGSEVENIDLSQPLNASERINDWVSQQIQNDTGSLSQSQTLISDIHDVLVNALYFKPKLDIGFNAFFTKKRDFHINPWEKVSVDTMFNQFNYRYAEFPTLNAKVLELPYIYYNITMLIFLPNEINGLKKLERDLKRINLNAITSDMRRQYLNVYLPKFRIESEVDLKEPLKKMGCSTMFENTNLSNMLGIVHGQKTLDVKQKTIFDFNGKGAGVPFDFPKSTIKKEFRADHPFVFIIRTKTMVLYYGHVAKF